MFNCKLCASSVVDYSMSNSSEKVVITLSYGDFEQHVVGKHDR